MAFYIVTYQALVNGVVIGTGVQGATPKYNPNALKDHVKKYLKEIYPEAKQFEVVILAHSKVTMDEYWAAQKDFTILK